MGKVEVDGGGDVYVAVKAHDGVNDEVNLKVGGPRSNALFDTS